VAANRVRCIHVLISPSDIRALEDEIEGPEANRRIRRAVIRYGIKRVEHGLLEGLFPPPSQNTDNLPLEEADLSAIRLLVEKKTCIYQLKEDRDLLCSAAAPEDKTARGTRGFRFMAPTSRAICYACTLPDTDYLCSHFLHPEIRETDSNARQLSRGLCDIGRSDIQKPEQCHADGHGCWEWLVEPTLAQPETPPSPLALAEALDFLETAWRLGFGKRKALFQLRDTVTISKLSQACTTRVDFESQLSALADILKAMDIPDELLSKTEEIKKDHSLTRLLDCLQARLETNDYQEVDRAVSTIRTVNNIRVALQHSGASRELPANFAKLGIPYPPEWHSAWDRIRTATIEALRVVREKVLKYAREVN
jgi:hypothetical protein